MSNPKGLPKGWKVATFGDVVRQVNQKVDPEAGGIKRYVAGEHMDTDDLRIRRWGNVGDGYLGPAFTAHFLPGHVLYGSRRTYLRKVAVAEFEGVCANTTFVLESSSDNLLSEFLPYVMSTERFHEHSIKQSKGSVNPYINFRDLTWYEFALPPLEEQKRIVEVLQAAEGSADALRNSAMAATSLVRSIEDKAWSGMNSMHPLGEMAQITVGIVVRPADLYVKAGGVPALRSLNVTPNGLSPNDLVHISAEGHAQHPKSALVGGEVVVVRSGRPGDAAVIPNDGVSRNAIDLLIVRCSPQLSPAFLSRYLNSSVARRHLLGRSAGTAQQHLNAGQLTQVLVPSVSLALQDEILDTFRSPDTVLQESNRATDCARTLRAKLVERLTEGVVGVH